MAHLCPVWAGTLLASPLRKLRQDPERILSPYVEVGMTVLDMGCAKGFFSLPLAGMVGPSGRVLCLDCQRGMLDGLARRARSSSVKDRLVCRLCRADSLGIKDYDEGIDFALAFAVVHEVPDQRRFFSEIAAALKPGARFLVAEPRGHVCGEAFAQSLRIASRNGFAVEDEPAVAASRAALLRKEPAAPV